VLNRYFRTLGKSVFFLASPAFLVAGCTQATPDKPVEIPAQVLAAGQKIYTDNCDRCHQADGSGAPDMEPSLARDDVVNGDPDLLIRVVLQDPTNALPPNHPGAWDNYMPSFDQLSDEQVADLLTYVRHSFGNQADPIDVKQVTAVRSQLKL
jgi:mono/diheme cytochrome c family protein